MKIQLTYSLQAIYKNPSSAAYRYLILLPQKKLIDMSSKSLKYHSLIISTLTLSRVKIVEFIFIIQTLTCYQSYAFNGLCNAQQF